MIEEGSVSARQDLCRDKEAMRALGEEARVEAEREIGLPEGALFDLSVDVPNNVKAMMVLHEKTVEVFEREVARRESLEAREDYWRDWQ